MFADLHTDNGVDLRCGVTVAAIRPAGTDPTTAGGVQLADGTTLDADVVIVGIGVTPNVELARSCRAQRRQRHPRRRAPAHLRRRHLRRRGRRQRLPPAAGPAPPRRTLGQRAAPAGRRRQDHARQGRHLRPAALLLHRPVRPGHGVHRLRRARRLRPGRDPRRPARPRVHRVLAARPARAGRDERQHLGRHRADPGAHPLRRTGRCRNTGRPRRPTGRARHKPAQIPPEGRSWWGTVSTPGSG